MKKVAIIYGSSENGVQRKSVELLSKIILDYTCVYPICIKYGDESVDVSNYIKIYTGTKNNNAYINDNLTHEFSHSEEYFISAKDDNVIIGGSDDSGVLYGCADFYNKYILSSEYIPDGSKYWENPFDKDLPYFEFGAYPTVHERGIWTWGHVIYDYKGFIDNMVRLKLNRLTIWNDAVPFNAKDIIAYAHNSGVKVIWGYSWFWDTSFDNLDIKNVCDGISNILKKYETDYLPLGGDGIYFQSFTELDREYIGDVLIADAVTEFVNKAATAFFEKYPMLELEFGLHATSVKEKLEYIKRVDKRVRIVWENCGAFPFDYLPTRIADFDETIDFVNRISVLRGSNDKFGLVLKGMTKLDWSVFEHINGSVCLGVSTKHMREVRKAEKQHRWRYLESHWFTNAEYVIETIKRSSENKSGDIFISALIEDGMFEEAVTFPAAFFAESLWDPGADAKKLITEISLRNYVEFA